MPVDPHLPLGPKRDILLLLARRELAAHDLARNLGITLPAVRQHLTALQAQGLVLRRRLVMSAGRPIYLYRLSGEGQRAFPKRYDLLLAQLIEVLLEHHGVDAITHLVEAAARRIAERARDRFQHREAQARWELLVDWLEEELAWQAEVADEPTGGRRITIHQCPFQDVSRARHPVICSVLFTTLIRALYAEVAVAHVLATVGPACCSLVVTGVSSAPGNGR